MIKKLFLSIDQKLFAAIDKLKLSPAFQQALAPLEDFSDEIQTLFNRTISILLPSIPVLVFLVVLLLNVKTRMGINDKEDLLGKIQEISTLTAQASSYSGTLISPSSFTTKEEFNVRLKSIAGRALIDSSDLTTRSFIKENLGSLNKSLIQVSFENLSTAQFTKLLNQIMLNEKMKVDDINLKKKKTLLFGTFNLVHFAKMASPIEAAGK